TATAWSSAVSRSSSPARSTWRGTRRRRRPARRAPHAASLDRRPSRAMHGRSPMKLPIHFKQLEPGPMQNYVYLLGDPNTPEVEVGQLKVKFLHTPGHTPGSQCFLVGNALVSGDTLFIGSCGRVDLPGSNPDDMYRSLTQVLAALPDETLLFPGHNYADRPRSTIGDEKRTNMMLRFRNLHDFLAMMGGPQGG